MFGSYKKSLVSLFLGALAVPKFVANTTKQIPGILPVKTHGSIIRDFKSANRPLLCHLQFSSNLLVFADTFPWNLPGSHQTCDFQKGSFSSGRSGFRLLFWKEVSGCFCERAAFGLASFAILEGLWLYPQNKKNPCANHANSVTWMNFMSRPFWKDSPKLTYVFDAKNPAVSKRSPLSWKPKNHGRNPWPQRCEFEALRPSEDPWDDFIFAYMDGWFLKVHVPIEPKWCPLFWLKKFGPCFWRVVKNRGIVGF